MNIDYEALQSKRVETLSSSTPISDLVFKRIAILRLLVAEHVLAPPAAHNAGMGAASQPMQTNNFGGYP